MGIGREIAVDRHSVFGFAQTHPVGLGFWLNGNGPLPLSEEQDVGGDLRPGVLFKGVVGEAYSAQKLRPLSQVAPDGRVRLVHRAFRGHEGHYTARTHQVQRLREEVVMNEKILTVVFPVGDLIAAERYVADGHVEVVVREGRLLEAAHLDVRRRVKPRGDPSRHAVQLDAVEFACLPQRVRQEAEEVPDPHSRFQNSAALIPHVVQSLVHGLDDRGACVVGVKGGSPRGGVLVLRQQPFQLRVLPLPVLVLRLENLGDAAPTHVLRKGFLLF